jgi:hypothetical protein
MTETPTPPPAEQAIAGASTTALVPEAINPTHFIPTATQDNYATLAREQAGVRGVEPRQVMQELADQWLQLHERQPLDGYDHLAAWARDFDPAATTGPTGLEVLQARALESARRDPYQAVIGDQALVEQGVAAQQAMDEAGVGITSAPVVSGDTGLLPNAGPLTVPADVTPATDPAVAEQQQAAAEQQASGDATPPPAPEPTPPPEPPSGSGSGSGKSSGKSSS